MKPSTLFAIAFIALLFSAGSCKKNDTDMHLPALVISSPTPSQLFYSGDTIHLRGTATASAPDDAHLLHDVLVEVKWAADSSNIFSAYYSAHMKESFAFDTFLISPNVGAATPAFVQAKVQNHLWYVTTRTVPIVLEN